MRTLQGDFASAEAAERAVAALLAAGVEAGRIRKWNVIPPRPASEEPAQGPSVARSAATGYLVGGLAGAAVGAALGAARGGEKERPMPDATGVRVVVELDGAGDELEGVLRACGAVNVQRSR